MNLVKRQMYFNQYCLDCGWRYPDIYSDEDIIHDDCLNEDVLARYLAYTVTRAVTPNRQLVGLECINAISYCKKDYYVYKEKRVGVTKEEYDNVGSSMRLMKNTKNPFQYYYVYKEKRVGVTNEEYTDRSK